MSPGSIERIAMLLHEAALDDAQWLAAAALINEACETRASSLSFGRWHPVLNADLSFARLVLDGQRRRDLERKYFANYWSRDEGVARIPELPEGQLVPIGDLYTDSEKKTSAAYNEARPAAAMQKGLTVRLDVPELGLISWHLGDSTARTDWSGSQLGTVTALLPHVLQFARVRQALGDAHALGHSLARLLDNVRCGVIMVDRRARIVAANDRATRLLSRREVLYDVAGSLLARPGDANDRLQRLFADALAPLGAPVSSGSMVIHRPPATTGLAVHILPISERGQEYRTRQVAALVLVVDPESQARIDPDVIAAALGLSETESRLAAMVASGQDVRAVAAATGRAENTVRWHLQRIFRKQHISSQAELVRRVLALGVVSPAASPDPATGGPDETQ